MYGDDFRRPDIDDRKLARHDVPDTPAHSILLRRCHGFPARAILHEHCPRVCEESTTESAPGFTDEAQDDGLAFCDARNGLRRVVPGAVGKVTALPSLDFGGDLLWLHVIGYAKALAERSLDGGVNRFWQFGQRKPSSAVVLVVDRRPERRDPNA